MIGIPTKDFFIFIFIYFHIYILNGFCTFDFFSSFGSRDVSFWWNFASIGL